jgi:hypothetical protein
VGGGSLLFVAEDLVVFLVVHEFEDERDDFHVVACDRVNHSPVADEVDLPKSICSVSFNHLLGDVASRDVRTVLRVDLDVCLLPIDSLEQLHVG